MKAEEKKQPSKVQTLFDADDPKNFGAQRLDQIYGHLKELQAFKDQIMDDLDDFMSEVESTIPISNHQLEQVVDLVADEERSKADNLVSAYMRGDQLQI